MPETQQHTPSHLSDRKWHFRSLKSVWSRFLFLCGHKQDSAQEVVLVSQLVWLVNIKTCGVAWLSIRPSHAQNMGVCIFFIYVWLKVMCMTVLENILHVLDIQFLDEGGKKRNCQRSWENQRVVTKKPFTFSVQDCTDASWIDGCESVLLLGHY